MDNNFILFVLASFLLNITPGSDMLYVATRSTGQGTKAGIVSALGIMAGCIVHMTASVVGLSAVLATSATAFMLIKYAGACYLAYLGLRSFFNKDNSFVLRSAAGKKTYGQIFWQGVATNVLNPKVALFFLAFIPQFVDHTRSSVQFYILLLGLWFTVSGTLVNIGIAALFGRMGNWLANKAWFVRWQNKITGVLLIGLGLKIALAKK